MSSVSPAVVQKALARIPAEWRHVIAQASINASAADIEAIDALADQAHSHDLASFHSDVAIPGTQNIVDDSPPIN